jgi:hypothetical protein
MEMYP